MKTRTLSVSARLAAIACGSLWLMSASMVQAQTVAYDATPVQPGNQGWTGNLGLDFNVITPIVVSQLGVFDSNGDGSTGTFQVAIFSRATAAVVAGPLTFKNNQGSLTHSDRFKNLGSPVTLPPGNYSVVAVGFSALDMNGNSTISAISSTENTGLAIQFVGSGRYDANTSLDFPTIVPAGAPSNVFLAGTFKFTSLVPNGAGTFITGGNVPAGQNPDFVVVDNFNTPNASLAAANFGDHSVSVALGNGDGTFAAQKKYKVGMNPRAISVGDLNGDLLDDLAVANFGDGSVSIMLGTGAGNFPAGTAPSYPAGSNPYGIAVGHFNAKVAAKNFVDLVVVNDNQGLSLLVNNGNGTFQPPIPITDRSLAPSSIVAADFNNDGFTDIAVANSILGSVTVLLGNGDRTFQPPIPTTLALTAEVAPRPLFITAGRFNETSGNTDIAVTDIYGNGSVLVLLGLGNGHFLPAVQYPAGFDPTSVAVGDVNGDGHADLVVTNSNAYDITVLTGDGTGKFVGAGTYSAPNLTQPVSVALGVFNTTLADSTLGTTDAAVADFFGGINIFLGSNLSGLSIAQVSGNNQTVTGTADYPNPLVVSVTPAQKGVPVTFTVVPGGGGSSASFDGGIVTSLIVTTNAAGKATSPIFTANGVPGTFTIIASVGFSGVSTTFTENIIGQPSRSGR